jgi:hypothetical protein
MLVQYCDQAITVGFDVLFSERQWKLWTGGPGDTPFVDSVRDSQKGILTTVFVHEDPGVAADSSLTRSCRSIAVLSLFPRWSPQSEKISLSSWSRAIWLWKFVAKRRTTRASLSILRYLTARWET